MKHIRLFTEALKVKKIDRTYYTPDDNIKLLNKYLNSNLLLTISNVDGLTYNDSYNLDDFYGNNDNNFDIILVENLIEYNTFMSCIKKMEDIKDNIQEIFDLDLFQRFDAEFISNENIKYTISLILPDKETTKNKINICREIFNTLDILNDRIQFKSFEFNSFEDEDYEILITL